VVGVSAAAAAAVAVDEELHRDWAALRRGGRRLAEVGSTVAGDVAVAAPGGAGAVPVAAAAGGGAGAGGDRSCDFRGGFNGVR